MLQRRAGRTKVIASDNGRRECNDFDVTVWGDLQCIMIVEASGTHTIRQSDGIDLGQLLLQFTGDWIHWIATCLRQNACSRIRIEIQSIQNSSKITIHHTRHEARVHLFCTEISNRKS